MALKTETKLKIWVWPSDAISCHTQDTHSLAFFLTWFDPQPPPSCTFKKNGQGTRLPHKQFEEYGQDNRWIGSRLSVSLSKSVRPKVECWRSPNLFDCRSVEWSATWIWSSIIMGHHPHPPLASLGFECVTFLQRCSHHILLHQLTGQLFREVNSLYYG